MTIDHEITLVETVSGLRPELLARPRGRVTAPKGGVRKALHTAQ
jgi:hypothetical protein